MITGIALSFAIVLAMAAPMPLAPPVISTTLSFSPRSTGRASSTTRMDASRPPQRNASCSKATEKHACSCSLQFSSAEITEPTVDRIIHSSDESGFVRTQEKSQGGHFFWCSHSADRLSCGELREHVLFFAWIIALKITVDERRVDSCRRNTVTTDLIFQIVLRYRIRHRDDGPFTH